MREIKIPLALIIFLVLLCTTNCNDDTNRETQTDHQSLESCARDFLMSYSKGDFNSLSYLIEDSGENALAKGCVDQLRKYPFPIHSIKSLGYSVKAKSANVRIEIPDICYLTGAAAGEMEWDKLKSARIEIIEATIPVVKKDGKTIIRANDLIIMIGMSAHLAW